MRIGRKVSIGVNQNDLALISIERRRDSVNLSLVHVGTAARPIIQLVIRNYYVLYGQITANTAGCSKENNSQWR